MAFCEIFRSELTARSNGQDPAHDILHLERVVSNARRLCLAEGARWEIVQPAAWFHDYVVILKNDPRRSEASRLSAETALKYLDSIHYPREFFDGIAHAIHSHSFSANIKAETLEAKIVQDADRLDGLGAIGIARCFATAGLLRRPFYSVDDPFCDSRSPSDLKFTIDHFYQKLFKTAETLQTTSAQEEGLRRAANMRSFLSALRAELFPDSN